MEEDAENDKILRYEKLKVYFTLDVTISSKIFFFYREPYVCKSS